MGSRLLPPNPANPKGYFEDAEVNAINEELLAPFCAWRPPGLLGRVPPYCTRPRHGERWLARVPVEVTLPPVDHLLPRMAAQLTAGPYCLKDPRFCYTLPAWRPLLDDPVFLCVFRHPAQTANSMLKVVRNGRVVPDLWMGRRRSLEVWTLMYSHVLARHRHHGEWHFVHFDQVMDGTALPLLERVLGVTVDRSFPEPLLRRSTVEGPVGPQAEKLYRELCRLAGADPAAGGRAVETTGATPG